MVNASGMLVEPALAARNRPLTETQRHDFFRDGILFPVRVLSPHETQWYRDACDELESLLGGRPRTIDVRQMHLHFRWAYDLVTHARVLDAVSDVLGPDLLVWASELFAKHPFDSGISIGWHRDRPYMGFDPQTTVTAWVALSESTIANGCMKAIPGPDRRSAELDDRRSVDVVLRPGEMSLHDAEILHGSATNRSATKRVGFAIRFLTPDARPLHGRPAAVVARGHYAGGHFHVVDPPADRPMEESLAELKRSAAVHFDAMLENLNRKDG